MRQQYCGSEQCHLELSFRGSAVRTLHGKLRPVVVSVQSRYELAARAPGVRVRCVSRPLHGLWVCAEPGGRPRPLLWYCVEDGAVFLSTNSLFSGSGWPAAEPAKLALSQAIWARYELVLRQKNNKSGAQESFLK